MVGAIIGDIIGSRFERHNLKKKDFELFTDDCCFTDDTVLTLAIAKALMDCGNDMTHLAENAVRELREMGRAYPHAGYTEGFNAWLKSDDPKPYNSFGNGAAMRVSPCGDAAQSLEEARVLASDVTHVSHNHPEGLKGAEAVSVSVYLARSGMSKDELRTYISENYYPLDFTLDQIRGSYEFDISAQGTVPQALLAFFEAETFEDAIRNAISIGGDSDTIAAIAGGVGGNYFSIPNSIRTRAFSYLNDDFIQIIEDFEAYLKSRTAQQY